MSKKWIVEMPDAFHGGNCGTCNQEFACNNKFHDDGICPVFNAIPYEAYQTRDKIREDKLMKKRPTIEISVRWKYVTDVESPLFKEMGDAYDNLESVLNKMEEAKLLVPFKDWDKQKTIRH